MIDLRWTELSFGLSFLFNISFVLYVILFFRRSVHLPMEQDKKTNSFLLLISLLLIILVSANSGSDWYSYQDWVWNYDFHVGSKNYGEPIYGYIIQFVNQNYLLFRLMVWGSAFFFSCIAFKRFGISVNAAVFFMLAVYLLRFNYARSTLAMASYFLGLTFLVKPMKGKRIISFCFAALLFWGAYEFHHSFLPILFLSFVVFLPVDRPWALLLLVLILPLFAYYFKENLDLVDRIGSDYLSTKMEKFVEKKGETANFLGLIADILLYGSFVLPIIIDSLAIVKYRKTIDLQVKRLFRITIGIALFSVSFLFMGLNSSVFTYRYLFMTFIPLTIITVYLYQNRVLNRTSFSVILLWGIVSNMQQLIVGLNNTL